MGNAPTLAAEPDAKLDAARENAAPLSFAQTRLWLLNQLAPGDPAYNVFVALKLIGEVDRRALYRAFWTIIARHESLRTTYAVVNGEPVQIVASQPKLRIPLIDLQELPPSQHPIEIERQSREEMFSGFDLQRDLLLRVRLLRLGPRESALFVTLHHIAADGWSVSLLFRELATLYGGSADAAGSLPPLLFQYQDYARRQRREINHQAVERQILYWRRHLAGAEAFRLPLDWPRRTSSMPSLERTETMNLPGHLAMMLNGAAVRLGMSLFMVFLTALAIVLHHLTGRPRIPVSVSVANRDLPEVENLIGFFVNQVVICSDTSGNPTVNELLSRVREAAMEGLANSELPFDQLVKELRPDRYGADNSLFQMGFAWQNIPAAPNRLGDLNVVHLKIDGGAARVDLELHVWEHADHIECLLSYRTSLFRRSTVRHVLECLRNTLEQIALHSEFRLHDIQFPARSMMSSPMPRSGDDEFNFVFSA